MNHESNPKQAISPETTPEETNKVGSLIINADDWGRDYETTNRIYDCVRCETVSSVSAMVFMDDSERAATIAREREVDAGLHLNLTTPFSSDSCPPQLMERQRQIAVYLRGSRFSPVLFNPALKGSFEYVVASQIDEFERIYGAPPARLDGHHHMHLCANVLFGGLLPADTIVRRNFSFQKGEKSYLNRFYRATVDRVLARRHHLVDFFFSLPPFDPPSRVERILGLAKEYTVEAETHPVNPEEYRYLTEGVIFRQVQNISIAPAFAVERRKVKSVARPLTTGCVFPFFLSWAMQVSEQVVDLLT